MHDDVAQFRDYYADRFAVGMAKFVSMYGQSFFAPLQETLRRNRSVIYLFGNGGSHAICQCLSYALKAYASERGQSVRVQTGVDIHQVSGVQSDQEPGISFTKILHDEGADERDIVILVSGSGDSDNLSATARYTSQRAIPTFALLGSSDGKISALIPAERRFVSPFADQQISEDIIQSFAYFFDRADEIAPPTNWSAIALQRAEQLREIIKNIPVSLLDRTANLIIRAFDEGKIIWVLGLDHPALSACAEHTAHNLYWDGIYQVANPPRRLIASSATACNFSGISNDRRRGVFRNLTGIHDAKADGLALLYAVSSDGTICRDLIHELQQAKVPTCLFLGEVSPDSVSTDVAMHATGLLNPQMQAGVAQIFGHMVGRLLRLKLLQRESSCNAPQIQNPAEFLINFDLAQRRLLDNRS